MNLRTGLHLGLITCLASFLVLWISNLTEEARMANRQGAAHERLGELLEAQLVSQVDLDPAGLSAPLALCGLDGDLQNFLIPGSAAGYAGEIEFVAALNAVRQVTGVRVTSHSETPGIGDVIEIDKSPWIRSLGGKNAVSTNWELVHDGGDIDGISGATITLRGLVRGIGSSLLVPLPECGE